MLGEAKIGTYRNTGFSDVMFENLYVFQLKNSCKEHEKGEMTVKCSRLNALDRIA